MFTVLLVDDEESVLDILKANIGWQEFGVNNLLTASDGQLALELFEQYHIDLLITDIRMPRIGGIELIRKIRHIDPDTHCILLTAYGEFEYAKSAIQLGVDNYLLKPVALEEVEQTIRSTLDNIYKNRHNSSKLLLENTLRRWVSGTISSEELSERAAVLGLNLYRPAYCALCIVKKRRVSTAAFRSACLEKLSEMYDINCLWDEKGRYIVILGGKIIDIPCLMQKLVQLAQEEGVYDDVAVAIGAIVGEADALHVSCQSACDAIEMADLSSSGVIIQSDINEQSFDADLLVEELRTIFYEPDAQKRRNEYQGLAIRWCKSDANMLKRLIRGCIQLLIREFPTGEDLRGRISSQIAPILGQLSEADSIAKAIEILTIAQAVFAEQYAQLSPIVQRAIQYIQNSVQRGDGVSIKDFCAYNGMNPAYLGHLFKKETGVFFNDYLTQCRLNRSVFLLHNPNKKVKDIADACGFASTSYFVKCFREYKGVSPSKYRVESCGRY